MSCVLVYFAFRASFFSDTAEFTLPERYTNTALAMLSIACSMFDIHDVSVVGCALAFCLLVTRFLLLCVLKLVATDETEPWIYLILDHRDDCSYQPREDRMRSCTWNACGRFTLLSRHWTRSNLRTRTLNAALSVAGFKRMSTRDI
jgi:hypothetical protein